MKLKKLHIAGSILAAGIALTTLQSNSSGSNAPGLSTIGCGGSGCHGTQSNATVIGLTGLPTNWVVGTTYPLTLTVTNSTASRAGFDLSVNIGTLTAVTSGTAVMGSELHHTTPQNLTSGTATWTFNWKAPATTTSRTLTMNVAGNAVNGNGSADANDHWNTNSFTSAASSTSIASISDGGFSVYPNPAKDQVTVTAKAGQDVQIAAIAIDGKHVVVASEKVAADRYQVNTSTLSTGVYMLLLSADGKTYATRFVKQ